MKCLTELLPEELCCVPETEQSASSLLCTTLGTEMRVLHCPRTLHHRRHR